MKSIEITIYAESEARFGTGESSTPDELQAELQQCSDDPILVENMSDAQIVECVRHWISISEVVEDFTKE